MKIGETVAIENPDNLCFGCSQHNPRGLNLVFTRTGEKTIEVNFTAEPHLCGAANVVHGGIQAALLDEASGFACHTLFDGDGGDGDDSDYSIVTAEFKLRYRRPVPTETPLVIRGEVLRREGRSIFIEGAILDAEGNVLTESEARWVHLE